MAAVELSVVLPRLCCLECMTRSATIHRSERRAYADDVLVWAECKCRHWLIDIDGQLLASIRHTPDRAVPLDYAIDISASADELYASAEKAMLEAQERVQWLDAFIKQRPAAVQS